MSDLPSLTFLDDLLDSAPVPAAVAAVLAALPFALVPLAILWLAPGAAPFSGPSLWRQLLLAPVLVVYSLLLIPRFHRLRRSVIDGLWPIVDAGSRSRAQLLADMSRHHPRGDFMALASGVIIGLLLNVRALIVEPSVANLLAVISFMVTWAMGAWVFYYLIRTARSTNRLLALPLTIDLFNLHPFDPIGRLALMMALSVIGGMLITLVLGFSPGILLAPEFWIAYGLVVAVAVVIFVIAMHATHQLLATTKAARLKEAELHLSASFAAMRDQPSAGPELPYIAAEIQAWTAYQRALREARTWPYNTRALRTLTVSVLTPLFLGLARLIGMLLTT